MMLAGLVACASIGNTYASGANTQTLLAKRTRRKMQCISRQDAVVTCQKSTSVYCSKYIWYQYSALEEQAS